MSVLSSVYARVGTAHRKFDCCDTRFVVRSTGARAAAGVGAAKQIAQRLEGVLDAFDGESAVRQLNQGGSITDEHVARVVRRGLEYYERTDGMFDIHQGRVEHNLKAFLSGDRQVLPETFDTGGVSIDRDEVRTDHTLDLNGLAKGYIVDQAAAALAGVGREGFVSGGGDMSPPIGPVAVESPYGDEKPLKVLDTDWSTASSGGYRRTRAGVDHIYDPVSERLGSRHESVTVVAERDCMEADALATTLSALPLDEGLSLAESWDCLEALVVHSGVFHTTEGFKEHVME